jgi:hypothetical protein
MLSAGKLYEVKGTYNLVSRDHALTGVFVSAGSPEPLPLNARWNVFADAASALALLGVS